ncbi:CNP1-like family protein [Azonexus sp.]|uniref:CNP1-like family protein n=1 Tax=Azonexus sp. TaxID=1872668 RepID=UPI0027BA5673|nr:CNP1-like family protein [Azonexus sp.]
MRSVIFKALLCAFLYARAMFSFAIDFDEAYETRQWQEVEHSLPGAPKQEAMQSFYVSATSTNVFSIDLSSLTVGQDGVVRYVLLVDTPGGVRNITYEGIRCETAERRIYASGRRDGRWSKSRNNSWSRIRDIPPNRHHAELFVEYFCPGGFIVSGVAEAEDALRKGGHQLNRQW